MSPHLTPPTLVRLPVDVLVEALVDPVGEPRDGISVLVESRSPSRMVWRRCFADLKRVVYTPPFTPDTRSARSFNNAIPRFIKRSS